MGKEKNESLIKRDKMYFRFRGMVRKLRRNLNTKTQSKQSELENQFEFILTHLAPHLPPFFRNIAFAPGRKWKADFIWPDQKLMVEIEGGIYVGGRHVQPVGYQKDCEKYNAAILLGWHLFRFTDIHLKNGYALKTILEFFEREKRE